MKRIPAVLLLCGGLFIGFLCGALLTEARSDQPKTNFDQVVALLGDTKITRGELADRVLLMKGQDHTQLGLDMLEGELQDKAIVEECARQQGVTVSDDEVDQRIKEALAVLPDVKNMPRPALTAKFHTVMLAEKMAGVTISDDEALKFYRTPGNSYLFAHPNMAKLVIISTKTRDKALQAYNRLKDGENVRDLSTQLSDIKALREKHGDVGWLLDRMLGPTIADPLFGKKPDCSDAMKPGQYTRVLTVTVPDALPKVDPNKPITRTIPTNHTEYWVVYVDDIKHAYMPAFEQVKQIAICYARLEKYQQMGPKWFETQAQAINEKKSWTQVKDLSDAGVPLKPVTIDLSKYRSEVQDEPTVGTH